MRHNELDNFLFTKTENLVTHSYYAATAARKEAAAHKVLIPGFITAQGKLRVGFSHWQRSTFVPSPIRYRTATCVRINVLFEHYNVVSVNVFGVCQIPN